MANLHIDTQCGWKYKWTEEEDNIVKKYYPINGWEKVHELLPNRKKAGIQCRAKKLQVKQFQYNSRYFENIDNCKKAYWLGFLYADGYITTENRWGLELQYEDIEHMENFLNDMQCNIPIKVRERNGHKYCLFQIKNSKMYNDLVKNGIVPQKTYKIEFPSFLKADETMLFSFICGFFDGDGTYFYKSSKSRGISCVCKVREFIESIQDILRNKGIESHIKEQYELFYLRIYKKTDMQKFIEIMLNLPVNMLERKKCKAIEILEYCLA